MNIDRSWLEHAARLREQLEVLVAERERQERLLREALWAANIIVKGEAKG